MAWRLILDPHAVEALLRSENGPIGVDLWRRLYRVTAAAKRRCPRRSGRLGGSIRPSMRRDSRGLVGVVGTDVEYALFVHEGTGLYGPRKRRIVPVTKRALYWKGARHPVRSVRGQRSNPFLRDALKEAG